MSQFVQLLVKGMDTSYVWKLLSYYFTGWCDSWWYSVNLVLAWTGQKVNSHPQCLNLTGPNVFPQPVASSLGPPCPVTYFFCVNHKESQPRDGAKEIFWGSSGFWGSEVKRKQFLNRLFGVGWLRSSFYGSFLVLFCCDRPRQRNRQFHRSTWMTFPKDSWPRFSRPGELFFTLTRFIVYTFL